MFLKTLRFKNLKRKIASTKLVLCTQNYISIYTQRIELQRQLFSQIINKPIKTLFTATLFIFMHLTLLHFSPQNPILKNMYIYLLIHKHMNVSHLVSRFAKYRC